MRGSVADRHIRGVHIAMQLADGLIQRMPVDRVVPREDSHRCMPGAGRDAKVVNIRAPGINDDRMPEIVKGGVGQPGFAARPLKRMRDTGGIVTRVHLLRVRLPGIHHGQVDEYPWTAHVSCSSFARACQCLVQEDEARGTYTIAWCGAIGSKHVPRSVAWFGLLARGSIAASAFGCHFPQRAPALADVRVPLLD
jgi:hypothetical protein